MKRLVKFEVVKPLPSVLMAKFPRVFDRDDASDLPLGLDVPSAAGLAP